jgi:hypothetical protein
MTSENTMQTAAIATSELTDPIRFPITLDKQTNKQNTSAGSKLLLENKSKQSLRLGQNTQDLKTELKVQRKQ